MTGKIIFSVIAGIFFGMFFAPEVIKQHMGILINVGLALLLFLVGIDIGRQDNILEKIKNVGFKVLLVPFMIALGSIFGTAIGGMFFNIPFYESAAIGAGFGWYSLSAVELAKHSPRLGTVAFITNVMRELIAFITIPLIAKYIGRLEAIAPAGATAMDTTLPIISKYTDGNVAIISFITGVILTLTVPVLVPLFMAFK